MTSQNPYGIGDGEHMYPRIGLAFLALLDVKIHTEHLAATLDGILKRVKQAGGVPDGRGW